VAFEKRRILEDGKIEFSETETEYKADYEEYYREYGKIMGYTEFNTADTAHLFGSDVEMPTYGEIINVISQSRANDALGKKADFYFSQIKETSDSFEEDVWGKLINGDEVGTYTLKELAKVGEYENETATQE
jgi:hypothetical protein